MWRERLLLYHKSYNYLHYVVLFPITGPASVSQSTYNMRRNGKDLVFSHAQTERYFYYNGARCIMSCKRKIRSATPTAVIRCRDIKLGPLIILRSLYDKDHMSELWIKNRSESDLRSCEVT